MSKISVIIPAYNAEKYIEETLESIINQTYDGDFNIIVVNDGSIDKTEDIIHNFVKKNDSWTERISLYNKENGGSASARNVGIDAASDSEYIAVIDADDLMMPTYLEEMSSKFDNNVACVFSHYYQFGDGLEEIEVGRRDFSVEGMLAECIPTSACMFNTKYLKRLRYDERYQLIEDYELHSRLCLMGDYIQIKKPLFKYRIHSNNKTKNDVTKQEKWHKEHVWVKTWLARRLGKYNSPKVSLLTLGGIGDLIAESAAIRTFKSWYPDSDLVLYTYPGPFFEINEYNPYIDKIHCVGSLPEWNDHTKAHYPSHKMINGDAFSIYGWDYWKVGCHLAEWYCRIMNVFADKDNDINSLMPDVYINYEDVKVGQNIIEKYGGKDKFITVDHHTRTATKEKTLPDNVWEDVFKYLSSLNVPIVCVGSKDDPYIDGDNIYNEKNNTIRQSMEIIRNSAFHIGQQGAYGWICDALRKPSVFINAGSPFGYAGRLYGDIELVDQLEVFSPDTIKSEKIIESIENAMEKWHNR